jgi:hypothetical protein
MATHPHCGKATAVRTFDIHPPQGLGQFAGGEQGAEPYTTVQFVYESQKWSCGTMPQF